MNRTSIRFNATSRSTNKFLVPLLLFGRLRLPLLTVCAMLLSLSLNAQGPPTFLYTNDNTTENTITAFSVAGNGALTQIGVFPTGGTGTSHGLFASNRVAVLIVANLLFASNDGSNDVSVFSVNPSTGLLSLIGSPVPTGGLSGNEGISLAATPDGKFLMAGNNGSSNISVFSITANGQLTPILGSPFAAGGSPDGMKVSPNGAFLAAGLYPLPAVAVLSIASNGALTPVAGSPFAGSVADAGVDIRCSGNQLFAGNATSGSTTVDVFSVAANGTLSPIPGSPFQPSVGVNSNGVLLSPQNQFLFVSNQNSDTITVFKVAANGRLTVVPGSPFPVNSGGRPNLMATNQSGTFLFTANSPGSIGVFTVASDGSLAAVGSPITVSGSSFLTSITVFPAATCTNPVPLIEQPFVPDATTAGSPQFTLTVNGAGFVSNSVVNWNGSALPTTVVNDNQVTATVPAANIAADGTASVTVTSPTPGGVASNAAFFTTTTPTSNISFSSALVGVGTTPANVVEGDFNNDGILDLAVTNAHNNTVSILLGKGDGTFQNQVTYPTGQLPWGIAVGDFNGDGKLDLAVTNDSNVNNGSSVSILLGNGDGTFRTQVSYPTGIFPIGIAVADFNGDGKLDLAVTNNVDVSILLGNGDGTFQNQVAYPTGLTPWGVAVGDFNGDGKLDLAVTNANQNSVSILLGNGDGTFQNQVPYLTGQSPFGIIVGDFNGDGRLDLALANGGSNNLSILLGNGDGTFQTQVTYPTGTSPIGVVLADFNGDGKLDLAVTNSATGNTSASILLGNGDGTFRSQMTFLGGATTIGIAVADFNRDGRLDLAVTNGGGTTLSILLQSSIVSFNPTSLNCGSQTVGMATVCSPSIVVTNTGTAQLTTSLIVPTGPNAGDFTETDNCVGNSLAPNATCTVQVTFTPTGVGPRSANLCFTDNAPNSPQCVPLSGIGITPVSTTCVSINAVQGIPIVPVTLVGSGGVGGPYTFAVTGGGLPPGLTMSTSGTISGTPTQSGTFNYTVTVTDSVGNSGTVNCSVAVASLSLTLAPTSLSFGPQLVGTTSGPQPVTLTNRGTAPLSIVSIGITGANAGDFAQTNNCGTTVAVGTSCQVNVTFAPTALGARNANLTFTDNAPNNPQSVPLSGTGAGSGLAAPTITTQPAGQTVNAGQTVTLSVVATGSQPLSYQWYQGQSGDTSTPVSGATNSSFTTPALMGTALYWVQVANGVPPVANSSTSTIIVSAPPVMTPPSQPVIAGLPSVLTQPLTAPPNSVNPLVTFVCTTVDGPNGVQNALDVGITCASGQVMLSSTPQNVAITINTTGSTLGLLSPTLMRRTSYAPALALPGLVLLGVGGSRRRSNSHKFFRYLVLGLLCILVVLCFSCGGGFTPPSPSPQGTPAGSYNITVIDQPVQGTPAGFVQTSLIVPLQVAH